MPLLQDHRLFPCRMPATARIVRIRGRKPVGHPCTHRLTAAVASTSSSMAPVVASIGSTMQGPAPLRLRIHGGRAWLLSRAYVDDKPILPVDDGLLAQMFMGHLSSERNRVCMPTGDIDLPEAVKRVEDDGLLGAEQALAALCNDLLLVEDLLHESVGMPLVATTLQASNGHSAPAGARRIVIGHPRESPRIGGVLHGLDDQRGISAFESLIAERTGASFVQHFVAADVAKEALAPFRDETALVERSIVNVLTSFGQALDVDRLTDAGFVSWLAVRSAFDGPVEQLIEAFVSLVTSEEHGIDLLMQMGCAAEAIRARIETSDRVAPRLLELAAGLDLFAWSGR